MAAGASLQSPPASNNAAGYPTTLQGALPGLNNLLGSASGNIANLLAGQPSASWARTTAAYAGANAGQPGNATDLGTFAGNMGANLYNQQANANQQTGLSDLLNLIGTSSGNLATTPGQNLQNTQFNQNLSQSGQEFNQSLAEQQFTDQINALIGLSNAGFGGTGGTAPQGSSGGGLSSLLSGLSSTLPPAAGPWQNSGTAYYGGGNVVNPFLSGVG